MTIKDYVGREYGYSYLVEFEDGVTGYIRDYEFSMSLIGQSMKGDGTEYCVTTYNSADQKKQKVFLGFALLLAAVFAHAEEVGITAKNAAISAALADSVTTKLVMQNGGFERNHLVATSTAGLVALAALKWGVVEAVDASSFSP